MAARLTAYLVALIVGTTLIAGLIVGAQRDEAGPVDLIVLNGKVYTPDGAAETAEAVAVQGNKILLVGSTRDVQRLRRPQTVVVDARGGTVLPGFNDAHTHLMSGGLSLGQVDLLGARTLREIETTIRSWAAANPQSGWVTGRGWYYEPFHGGLPTRHQLDALVSDRPAYLMSYDGHTAWVNTPALQLAGITRRTPNPANGVVVKDPRTGEPTGVLKESAIALVSSLLPKPSPQERAAAIRAAVEVAHRLGITSVQTASGTADDLAVLQDLRKRDELQLRVSAGLSAGPDISPALLAELEALRDRHPDDPVLKAGAVKLVADGVVESHTAALLAPYATRPRESGQMRYSADELTRIVGELDRRGWQVMIHAIGDRAIRLSLDAFEQASAANPEPVRGRRHRIEHIETIDPADVPRFGELGVIASMQPYHGLPDPGLMEVWRASLGDERASRGWLYGAIARAGGRLAFGSDWPVVTMDPLLGLFVAVNRTTPGGEPAGGWVPTERLSLRQALDAYTREAAWASFDEHRKGTLERDMLADIVVLSKDIFALPAGDLDEVAVAVTIFDGKIVYQRATSTN